MRCFVFGFSVLLFVLSCSSEPAAEGPVKPIKIGEQTWSYNLDIPHPQSICPDDCARNGRLYSFWGAVEVARSVEGWRFPTADDWAILEEEIKNPDYESSRHYLSGGDNLKRIKGFDRFPGYQDAETNGIARKDEWGMHWVNGTVTSVEGDTFAYCRVLKSRGRLPHMIYAPGTPLKNDPYCSLKLIKEE